MPHITTAVKKSQQASSKAPPSSPQSTPSSTAHVATTSGRHYSATHSGAGADPTLLANMFDEVTRNTKQNGAKPTTPSAPKKDGMNARTRRFKRRHPYTTGAIPKQTKGEDYDDSYDGSDIESDDETTTTTGLLSTPFVVTRMLTHATTLMARGLEGLQAEGAAPFHTQPPSSTPAETQAAYERILAIAGQTPANTQTTEDKATGEAWLKESQKPHAKRKKRDIVDQNTKPSTTQSTTAKARATTTAAKTSTATTPEATLAQALAEKVEDFVAQHSTSPENPTAISTTDITNTETSTSTAPATTPEAEQAQSYFDTLRNFLGYYIGWNNPTTPTTTAAPAFTPAPTTTPSATTDAATGATPFVASTSTTFTTTEEAEQAQTLFEYLYTFFAYYFGWDTPAIPLTTAPPTLAPTSTATTPTPTAETTTPTAETTTPTANETTRATMPPTPTETTTTPNKSTTATPTTHTSTPAEPTTVSSPSTTTSSEPIALSQATQKTTEAPTTTSTTEPVAVSNRLPTTTTATTTQHEASTTPASATPSTTAGTSTTYTITEQSETTSTVPTTSSTTTTTTTKSSPSPRSRWIPLPGVAIPGILTGGGAVGGFVNAAWNGLGNPFNWGGNSNSGSNSNNGDQSDKSDKSDKQKTKSSTAKPKTSTTKTSTTKSTTTKSTTTKSTTSESSTTKPSTTRDSETTESATTPETTTEPSTSETTTGTPTTTITTTLATTTAEDVRPVFDPDLFVRFHNKQKYTFKTAAGEISFAKNGDLYTPCDQDGRPVDDVKYRYSKYWQTLTLQESSIPCGSGVDTCAEPTFDDLVGLFRDRFTNKPNVDPADLLSLSRMMDRLSSTFWKSFAVEMLELTYGEFQKQLSTQVKAELQQMLKAWKRNVSDTDSVLAYQLPEMKYLIDSLLKSEMVAKVRGAFFFNGAHGFYRLPHSQRARALGEIETALQRAIRTASSTKKQEVRLRVAQIRDFISDYVPHMNLEGHHNSIAGYERILKEVEPDLDEAIPLRPMRERPQGASAIPDDPSESEGWVDWGLRNVGLEDAAEWGDWRSWKNWAWSKTKRSKRSIEASFSTDISTDSKHADSAHSREKRAAAFHSVLARGETEADAKNKIFTETQAEAKADAAAAAQAAADAQAKADSAARIQAVRDGKAAAEARGKARREKAKTTTSTPTTLTTSPPPTTTTPAPTNTTPPETTPSTSSTTAPSTSESISTAESTMSKEPTKPWKPLDLTVGVRTDERFDPTARLNVTYSVEGKTITKTVPINFKETEKVRIGKRAKGDVVVSLEIAGQIEQSKTISIKDLSKHTHYLCYVASTGPYGKKRLDRRKREICKHPRRPTTTAAPTTAEQPTSVASTSVSTADSLSTSTSPSTTIKPTTTSPIDVASTTTATPTTIGSDTTTAPPSTTASPTAEPNSTSDSPTTIPPSTTAAPTITAASPTSPVPTTTPAPTTDKPATTKGASTTTAKATTTATSTTQTSSEATAVTSRESSTTAASTTTAHTTTPEPTTTNAPPKTTTAASTTTVSSTTAAKPTVKDADPPKTEDAPKTTITTTTTIASTTAASTTSVAPTTQNAPSTTRAATPDTTATTTPKTPATTTSESTGSAASTTTSSTTPDAVTPTSTTSTTSATVTTQTTTPSTEVSPTTTEEANAKSSEVPNGFDGHGNKGTTASTTKFVTTTPVPTMAEVIPIYDPDLNLLFNGKKMVTFATELGVISFTKHGQLYTPCDADGHPVDSVQYRYNKAKQTLTLQKAPTRHRRGLDEVPITPVNELTPLINSRFTQKQRVTSADLLALGREMDKVTAASGKQEAISQLQSAVKELEARLTRQIRAELQDMQRAWQREIPPGGTILEDQLPELKTLIESLLRTPEVGRVPGEFFYAGVHGFYRLPEDQRTRALEEIHKKLSREIRNTLPNNRPPVELRVKQIEDLMGDYIPHLRLEGRRVTATLAKEEYIKILKNVESKSDVVIQLRPTRGQQPDPVDPTLITRVETQFNLNLVGIPLTHALKMQQVAKELQTVFGVRPVDSGVRRLINEGYPTKDIRVKGKSSNWGPQNGFICIDQSLSKKEGNPEVVAKQNKAIQSGLESGYYTSTQLSVSYGRLKELEELGSLKLLGKDASGKITIEAKAFRKGQSGSAYTFFAVPKLSNPRQYLIFKQSLSYGFTIEEPVNVVAEKHIQEPLTADYDLFFVAAKVEDFGPDDQRHFADVKKPELQRGSGNLLQIPNLFVESQGKPLGAISPRTKKLIETINKKINRGEYKEMVHHGEDAGNPASEMDDNFPATFYLPETLRGNYLGMPVTLEKITVLKDLRDYHKMVTVLKANNYHFTDNPRWPQVRRPSYEYALNRFKAEAQQSQSKS